MYVHEHQPVHCVKRLTVPPRSGVEWAANTRRCNSATCRQGNETDRHEVLGAEDRQACFVKTDCRDQIDSRGPHVGRGRGQKAGLASTTPWTWGAAWIRLVDLSKMALAG